MNGTAGTYPTSVQIITWKPRQSEEVDWLGAHAGLYGMLCSHNKTKHMRKRERPEITPLDKLCLAGKTIHGVAPQYWRAT